MRILVAFLLFYCAVIGAESSSTFTIVGVVSSVAGVEETGRLMNGSHTPTVVHDVISMTVETPKALEGVAVKVRVPVEPGSALVAGTEYISPGLIGKRISLSIPTAALKSIQIDLSVAKETIKELPKKANGE